MLFIFEKLKKWPRCGAFQCRRWYNHKKQRVVWCWHIWKARQVSIPL